MNRFLLLLAFLFQVLFSVGQIPDYFANNPEWRLNISGQPDCIFHDEAVYYLAGDSLLDDTLFQIMNIRKYRTYTYEPIGGIGSGGEVDCGGPYYSDQFYGLFRQENRKIYRRNLNNDETYLIADYDLEIGDVIDNYELQHEIVGIDSLLIGSSYRRIFYYGNGLPGYDFFIEGIANISHLFGMVDYGTLNYSSYYVCYSQNGETLHQSPIASENECYFDVSVDEYQKELDIRVYPNPSNLRIFIESSSLIGKIEIIDYSGRKVKEINSIHKVESIDVSDLNTGIYYLRVVIDNRTVYNHSFIKEG